MHCNVISEQTSLANVCNANVCNVNVSASWQKHRFFFLMLLTAGLCNNRIYYIQTKTYAKSTTAKNDWGFPSPSFSYHLSFSPPSIQEVLALHMPSTHNSHSIPPPKQMSPQGNFLRDFQVLPDLWSPLLNQGGVLCPSFEQTHPLRPNSPYLLDNWNGRREEKGKRVILTNIFHFHCPLMGTRGKG